MSDEAAANEAAVEAAREFLGGPWPTGDKWTFDLGEHLCSNWGAVFGGATAASALAVARLAAPDRSPRGLHVQMVRSLPSGEASAVARVRHAGRAVTTVEVELYDNREKLAAVALITAVRPDALSREYSSTAAPPFDVRQPDEPPDLSAVYAPITHTLKMLEYAMATISNVPCGITGDPASFSYIEPPWTDFETTGPELACLAADTANGGPIYAVVGARTVSWPNTDLTLRFTNAPADSPVTASGTLIAIDDGTTTVSIGVQAGGRWLAHGHSTSVLIPLPTDLREGTSA